MKTKSMQTVSSRLNRVTFMESIYSAFPCKWHNFYLSDLQPGHSMLAEMNMLQLLSMRLSKVESEYLRGSEYVFLEILD